MAGVMVAERRTSETRISMEPDMSRFVGILTVRVPMTAWVRRSRGGRGVLIHCLSLCARLEGFVRTGIRETQTYIDFDVDILESTTQVGVAY